jgi:hypothetical protein
VRQSNGQVFAKPRETTRRAPRIASPICLVRAGMKKPIPGRPGIGAHFWSFNFTNSLICGIVSSVERAHRTLSGRKLSAYFDPECSKRNKKPASFIAPSAKR